MVPTQLTLSVFSDSDSLFAERSDPTPPTSPGWRVHVGGPYGLWGMLCGAVSITIQEGSLWLLILDLPRMPSSPVGQEITVDLQSQI